MGRSYVRCIEEPTSRLGQTDLPSGDRSMEELIAERGVSLGDAYRLVTQHIPLRRPATAEEIAACILSGGDQPGRWSVGSS